MGKAAFTSSPWKVSTDRARSLIIDKAHNEICEITATDDSLSDNEKANAKLISLAPDLCVALEDLIFMLDTWGSGFTQEGEEFGAVTSARKLVQMAKGE